VTASIFELAWISAAMAGTAATMAVVATNASNWWRMALPSGGSKKPRKEPAEFGFP